MPLAPVSGEAVFPAFGNRRQTVIYANTTGAKAIYLRVRATNETWSGAYTMDIHRNTGSGFNDALELPNDAAGYHGHAVFSSGLGGAQPQTALYFHFKTGRLWSGAAQNIVFRAQQLTKTGQKSKSGDPTDSYQILIYNNKKPNYAVIAKTPQWPQKGVYTVTLSGQAIPPDGGDWFLVVARKTPVVRPQAYVEVSWSTNLRTLDLKSLWTNWAYGLCWFDQGEASLSIDDDPRPYFFWFGDLDRPLMKGWPTDPEPVLSQFVNHNPIDTHHINFAKNVTLTMKARQRCLIPGKPWPAIAFSIVPAVIPATEKPAGARSLGFLSFQWDDFHLRYEILFP